MLRALRGALPMALRRWWPTPHGTSAIRAIAPDGTLTVPKGYRQVLRLRGEPLDDARSAHQTLADIAAAVNNTKGTTTLLAVGTPGGLATALADRESRAASGHGALATLAAAQHAHLAQLGAGDRRQAPARTYTYYLIVESKTAKEVAAYAEDVALAFGATRVDGPEAAAIEAQITRGITLPPSSRQLFLSFAGSGEELVLTPSGARLRPKESYGTGMVVARPTGTTPTPA
jgi:hypothetical protein